jgi:hypothetical protein
MFEQVHSAVGELDTHDRLDQVLGLQALEAFGEDLLCDVGSQSQRFGPYAFCLDLVDVVVEEALVLSQFAQSVVLVSETLKFDQESWPTFQRPVATAASSKVLPPAS